MHELNFWFLMKEKLDWVACAPAILRQLSLVLRWPNCRQKKRVEFEICISFTGNNFNEITLFR